MKSTKKTHHTVSGIY